MMQGITCMCIVVLFSGCRSLDLNKKRKCLEFDDHLKRVKFKEEKKLKRKNKKNLPKQMKINTEKCAEKAYWKWHG